MTTKTSWNAQQLHATDRSFQKKPDQKLFIVGGYEAGDHASLYASKLITELLENVTLMGSVCEVKLLEFMPPV